MSDGMFFVFPVLGAVLPIIVTQLSSDQELKSIGRSVIKYAVLLPVVLVTTLVGVFNLVA